MAYLGDFRLGKTFDTKFCTVTTTGAPTVLAGTPVISAYVDNSVTQITAGITLSVDFDGVVGLNNVRVVATSGNGYATASNYQLVITTGTVGGTSVVGYVVGEFSIEARSALMPTTADLTLDVSAGGEAGVDWANVGSKTTSNALTGTTIATTQKVDIETIKTNPVVNGGTITFPTTATLASTTNITAATGVDITKILGTAISTPATAGILDVNVKNIDNDAASASGTVTFPNATLASTTNITAGTITTVTTTTTATNLTNAPTNGDFTAVMKTSIGTAVAASAVASVTGNVGGNVVGTVASVVGAVGSVTGNVGGNVTGSVGSVVGAVGSVTGNVGGNVTGTIGGLTAGALKDFFDTDSGTTYGSAVAGSVVKEIADNSGDAGDGSGLTAIPWNAAWDTEVQSEVTDALRAPVAGNVAAPGVLPSVEQLTYLIGQFLSDVDVTGVTKTIYAVDGVTPLFTLTLNSATAPTSTQRAT